jgi:AcrR family transcriptional regulator
MATGKSKTISSKTPLSLRREPTQGRAQQTVNTIFEATAQIVSSEGEAALSTNKIAQKAGFSIGTLYQYFPTKEAILQAMSDKARRAVMNQHHELLTRAEQQVDLDFEATLREFIHISVENFARGSKSWRAITRFAWRHSDLDGITASIRETSDRIALAFSRKPQKGWRPATPALMFVLTRSVLGAIRSAALEDSPLLDGPEFEDELVRLALGLLREESPLSVT